MAQVLLGYEVLRVWVFAALSVVVFVLNEQEVKFITLEFSEV